MKETDDIMEIGERNPFYLGSFDFYDLPMKELTLTIADIKEEVIPMKGEKGGSEAVCYFVENYKPMILNATNKKRLAKLYGTRSKRKLAGKRITIITEKVKAFGKIHDALRIKEVIPVAANVPAPKCEECGGDITAFGSMNAHQVASYTKERYGKSLCSRCATKAKEDAEKAATPQETEAVKHEEENN